MKSGCRARAAAVYTIATLILTVAPLSALAQPKQPSFEFKKPEEEQQKLEEVQWKAQLTAGLLVTTGNSRTTTFTAGGNTSRRYKADRFELLANVAYARSEIFLAVDENGDGLIQPGEVTRPEQTTTRAWELKARYDRFLTAANSLFVAALANADKPAGKQLIGGGQVGYSRQLYQSERHQLVGELGYDFSYEDYVASTSVQAIHSARAFVGYTGKVREQTGFNASVETLLNVNELEVAGQVIDPLEDARINGKAEITTQLYKDISFSFSFTARFDNAPAPRPPFALPYEPGFVPLADELDTITKASLIINFL